LLRLSGALTCRFVMAGEPPDIAGRTTCPTGSPPNVSRTPSGFPLAIWLSIFGSDRVYW